MKRIKAWAPAAVWMGVIFAMSAVPGETSGQQSGMLLELVLRLLGFLLGAETAAKISPDTLHLLIRKGAHMAEYAVLFGCYRYALGREGAKRPGLYALLLCAVYAATDEWHQSFSEDRGPSVIDVGIDTIGAGIAWGIWRIKEVFLPERRMAKDA